jgi:hypothetical protein
MNAIEATANPIRVLFADDHPSSAREDCLSAQEDVPWHPPQMGKPLRLQEIHPDVIMDLQMRL